MTGQSQALGPPAQAIETSVQVALRIRPIVTDAKNRHRPRSETEVLSLIERSPTPSLSPTVSGAGAAQQQHDQPQQVVVVPLQRHFTFDHIFGTGASQDDVYQGSVKRMVEKFMEGYNVTIMAYGQTSSGKTYTMGTAAPSSEDRGSPSEGIIPRAMNQLFQEAKRPPPVYPGYRMPPLKTTFRVSFVEIYNEDLIDLLAKGDYRPPVTIREDAKGNIYWTGVQEIVVTSVEEVIHLLWFGSQNRQTHSTEMNEKSSRSHAIFSITLRQEKFVPTNPPPPQPVAATSDASSSPGARRGHVQSPSIGTLSLPNGTSNNGRPGTPTMSGSTTPSGIPAPFTSGIVAPGSKLKRQSTMIDANSQLLPPATVTTATDDPEPEGEWIVLHSKFHFVDLAGSERLKRTSAIGDRAKEGISINAGLHALGNVISALGDPSKKASHVPYRDSKLTRLLQDSLGGNALALMIACVSPSEVNLGETLNTLKYANRARNIKNSSSLNQEINMDNPEYLRSIIQKLKQEIKLLKEAKAAKTGAISGHLTDESASETGYRSHRNSVSSVVTIVHGGRHSEDNYIDDRALLSPSPSRRLTHFQSRESISTDVSHGYLDSVVEEDDRYSDISSSTRTTTATGTNGSGTAVLSTSTSMTAVAAAAATLTNANISTRPTVPPIVIPPSLDSKSFEDFVEPVIEEYEKVISGLESKLAMTKAALDQSEQILEEQQNRIGAIEDENRQLLNKQKEQLHGGDVPQHHQHPQEQPHQDLKQALAKVQEQLKDAEARRVEGEQHIQELEEKLIKERTAAQEHINKITKEKRRNSSMSLSRSKTSSPSSLHQQPSLVDEEMTAKAAELNTLAEKVLELEEQCRLHQEQVEALRQAHAAARDMSEDSTTSSTTVTDDGSEADESKREEELIEKLQAKAALELELETERTRLEALAAEIEIAKKASRSRPSSAMEDHEESNLRQLAVSPPPPPTTSLSSPDITAQSARVQELEAELTQARESEQQLKEETITLTEKLDKLQKEHATALEMEEMLHLAVTDLETRLKSSQENEAKHQEELEQQLARIQDLELRSINAEKEALQVAEQLTSKLAEAKAAAEEQLADELLELLEKMEKERGKVEALQTQVENHLAELAVEKSRAADLELDRDAIQTRWDADKERIQILEKEIEEQSAQILAKAALIASLEERVSQHEGALEGKLKLEQELDRIVLEHDQALESKIVLIQELESKVLQLESSLGDSSPNMKELLTKVQGDLSAALEQLSESQAKVQEQERVLEEMKEQMSSLESEASTARDALHNKESEHAGAIEALEAKVKLAEADRDDAETRLEEVERRHQAVDEELKILKSDLEQNLAMIEDLQTKLTEAQRTPPSSRPVSISSSSPAVVPPGEDPLPTIQRLEKEKARYRALVRENEKEIERLSVDLESLASEFSNAATAFEDAEEEMKARITELESILEEKNASDGMASMKVNNLSSSSIASSLAAAHSSRNHDSSTLHPSSAAESATAAPSQQLSSLKAERDQAIQSSEELSLIVAELNEKNHSLQERLLNLEREQESMKLKHVLEQQAQQEELRALRDRAERLDRNANSPSPIAHHHHARLHEDDERVHDRNLRHISNSSDQFIGLGRGEDSLATPRQSWSTIASTSQQTSSSQPGSQIRAGRHESTLIQQAKQIKMLEERIAELQSGGGTPPAGPPAPSASASAGEGGGVYHNHRVRSSSYSPTTAVGLGIIQNKSSDQDLSSPSSRTVASPPMMIRQNSNFEKMSPAIRALATFGPTSANIAPPTPPPTAPLPPPPAGSGPRKNSTAAQMSTETTTASPGPSPHMRPSRTSSVSGNGRTSVTAATTTSAMATNALSPGSRREDRDSNASEHSEHNLPTNVSHSNQNSQNGGSHNDWTSPTNSMISVGTATGTISAATAQALQGVEVDELRGVVDTLAHQVQALKVEQTMQQGKIHRLEAALAETEDKLKYAHGERDTLLKEKATLTKQLESLQGEMAAARIKSEKDRAGLEGILERERKEREKAVETRAIMEARMEELMGRKSKFACF
ncbi:hypothetical protein BGX28_003287 [Mortierella sp. GBA30]|nr:hypothetical protein BGX28_003287 [Mortierella sp. GBA30]